MPRVNIPVQPLSTHESVVDAAIAADAANDHSFINDGKTVLVIDNGGAGASTWTVVSVADGNKRTEDLVAVVAASGKAYLGPFPKGPWNQGDGTINVDLDVDTTVTVTAVRFPLNP